MLKTDFVESDMASYCVECGRLVGAEPAHVGVDAVTGTRNRVMV